MSNCCFQNLSNALYLNIILLSLETVLCISNTAGYTEQRLPPTQFSFLEARINCQFLVYLFGVSLCICKHRGLYMPFWDTKTSVLYTVLNLVLSINAGLCNLSLSEGILLPHFFVVLLFNEAPNDFLNISASCCQWLPFSH